MQARQGDDEEGENQGHLDDPLPPPPPPPKKAGGNKQPSQWLDPLPVVAPAQGKFKAAPPELVPGKPL